MPNPALPDNNNVFYYRSNSEIPVGNPPVVIPPNTLYAIYNIAKGKYLLITTKTQRQVEGLMAQELSKMGTFVRSEIGEGKEVSSGVLESVLFKEAESAIEPSETDPVDVPADISLDQKVDKYLVRYEREAIPTSAEYDVGGAPPEAQSMVNAANNAGMPGNGAMVPGGPYKESKSISKEGKNGILEQILFLEAPGDPLAGGDMGGDPGGLGGGGDPAAPPGMGGDPAAPPVPKTPPVIDTPKMNMSNYCRAVARLVNNYEALLDPKSTIFGRAREYVRVNYDDATAKMFDEVMEQNYDMTATPKTRDASMAPPAAQAIYAGGGGGG